MLAEVCGRGTQADSWNLRPTNMLGVRKKERQAWQDEKPASGGRKSKATRFRGWGGIGYDVEQTEMQT